MPKFYVVVPCTAYDVYEVELLEGEDQASLSESLKSGKFEDDGRQYDAGFVGPSVQHEVRTEWTEAEIKGEVQ